MSAYQNLLVPTKHSILTGDPAGWCDC